MAVSLVVDCEDEVNGYGYEVMGMLFVLVDKDGMKDALEVWVDRLGVLLGTVDIVVSSVPVVVDSMGEVMGMLSVLVDKDGMTGVLVGMVNIVVSSGPVV